MKKSIRLFLTVPIVAFLIVAVCYLSFKVIEQSIIEENKTVVHSMAENLLPALLAGDAQQVDSLLKTLERHPGIQTAELISGEGVSLASYVRDGFAADPTHMQFALASADGELGEHALHVTAPLTFDTQILANLHIAVNLWPAYLRVIQWLGLLLILPSILYVVVKQMRIKIRFEINHDDSAAATDTGFQIDHLLQDALHSSDISLEYQPIQRLGDRGIFGAEVYVCWQHPSGQTLHISPADFIALAEKSGFFLPFEHWVLATACKQFAAWQPLYGPLVLALNIAPSQLKDAAFYQAVRDACEASQFPHQLIEFEISESALLRSSTARADVEQFVRQGMSLNIDGFGCSPRSHELLQNLPVHKIKFAPQLVKNIAHDAEMLGHLQSFASLASARDVQIMSDGLSAEDQTVLMHKLGCELGQGHQLNQVLSVKQFEEVLATQMRDAVAKQKMPQPKAAGAALGY